MPILPFCFTLTQTQVDSYFYSSAPLIKALKECWDHKFNPRNNIFKHKHLEQNSAHAEIRKHIVTEMFFLIFWELCGSFKKSIHKNQWLALNDGQSIFARYPRKLYQLSSFFYFFDKSVFTNLEKNIWRSRRKYRHRSLIGYIFIGIRPFHHNKQTKTSDIINKVSCKNAMIKAAFIYAHVCRPTYARTHLWLIRRAADRRDFWCRLVFHRVSVRNKTSPIPDGLPGFPAHYAIKGVATAATKDDKTMLITHSHCSCFLLLVNCCTHQLNRFNVFLGKHDWMMYLPDYEVFPVSWMKIWRKLVNKNVTKR